eukprot:CAMPEP_0114112618 /NCGR_PEP_ID=MMETSP0043_2-20121206/2480_1 /TAXON_ID=464988 /ORGANISM="Hemiselmis andersenii, Strain CCMP644" /LENGTH=219 /DNA_ID=CAMNT_0001204723 /DNA_START=160 /DNA_END=818 /DNA_ORIENTATION=+
MDWTHDWTSQRDRGRVYGSSDGTWAVLALDLGGLLVKQSIGANTGPDGQEGACLNRVSVAETGRLLFGHPRTLSRVFIGHTTAGRALLKPHSWPGSLGTMRKVVSGCIPLSANRRSTSALVSPALSPAKHSLGVGPNCVPDSLCRLLDRIRAGVAPVLACSFQRVPFALEAPNRPAVELAYGQERGTLATETRAAGGDQVPPALAAAARHCTAEQIQKS